MPYTMSWVGGNRHREAVPGFRTIVTAVQHAQGANAERFSDQLTGGCQARFRNNSVPIHAFQIDSVIEPSSSMSLFQPDATTISDSS